LRAEQQTLSLRYGGHVVMAGEVLPLGRSITSLLPQVPAPRRPEQQSQTENEARELLVRGDTVSLSSSSEKQVRDYIAFVASIRASEDGGEFGLFSDLSRYEKEARELKTQLGEISAEASIRTEQEVNLSAFAISDGTTTVAGASFELDFEMEFNARVENPNGVVQVSGSVSIEIDIDVLIAMSRAEDVQQGDPLALDIDGDGDISLSSYQDGVNFDLDADGRVDQTGFTTGQDVFLGLDRNQNGTIDDGRELFGDQNGSANGFIELARYDENQDGAIDARDSVYDSLVGVRATQGGSMESISLAALGVQQILLANQDLEREAQGGNTISQIGSYITNSGEERFAADVLLQYHTVA